MKLVRLARMIFKQKKPEGWQSLWEATINGIHMQTISSGSNEKEGLWLLMAATIQTDVPSIENNKIMVPPDERKKCEAALELVLNSISLFLACGRQIVSPSISVAFIPETRSEFDYLNNTLGIDISGAENAEEGTFTAFDQINDPSLIQHLMDRKTGVSLLSEAISHSLASGKYRDFIRLFENAFKLRPYQIDGKLVKFLNPQFGYTSNEIKEWVSIRDAMNHADTLGKKGKNTDFIALETDARKYVFRMQQAAYDVLFNKKEWGHNSSERRNVWTPTSFMKSKNDTNPLKHGTLVTWRILDPFNAYPLDMGGSIHYLPPFMYSKSVNKAGQTVGVFSHSYEEAKKKF